MYSADLPLSRQRLESGKSAEYTRRIINIYIAKKSRDKFFIFVYTPSFTLFALYQSLFVSIIFWFLFIFMFWSYLLPYNTSHTANTPSNVPGKEPRLPRDWSLLLGKRGEGGFHRIHTYHWLKLGPREERRCQAYAHLLLPHFSSFTAGRH